MNKYYNENDEARLDHGVKEAFASLHEKLLHRTLEETETLGLHAVLRAAANDAASLAWTTAFPLLVYPALLAEKLANARFQETRRERILERSQMILEQAV